jgi:predicted Co/Zn/Cd cation transporter (cation efflux family)
MSQRATDASALMLSAGLASLPIGAAATGILWASGNADPAVVALICAAPTALVLALSRLMKRAKETVEAAPAEIHQHYTGTVIQDQRSLNTTTRGIVAHTRNQIPR